MKLVSFGLLTWTCFAMPLWAFPLSHDQSAITTEHSLARRGNAASKACKNGACMATGAVNNVKNHATKFQENRLLKQEAKLKLKYEQDQKFKEKYPHLHEQGKQRQEDRRQYKNGAVSGFLGAVAVNELYNAKEKYGDEIKIIPEKISNWAKESFQGIKKTPGRESSVQEAKTTPLPQSNQEGGN